ncbi:MAG: GIY-YIG nuclease family protein [Bacteroidales bacterium]|nr:GIY-YIG nuclease family protein [Bacteroidales bacterium]
MYFTYVIFSGKFNKIYIGSSSDPEKRLLILPIQKNLRIFLTDSPSR